MAAFRKKRPTQEWDAPVLFLGEVVEELITGDFKSNRGQTMIYASGLCNRRMQCSGVWSECKWDNTQMNESLPLDCSGPDLPEAGEPEEPAVAPLPYEHPLFLVGMMGAGKTTIGRSLARLLNREFVDLDHELEARCGVRVSLIFDIEGEEGFRKRETTLLEECSRRPGIVLATGGGAILAPENRRYLMERGVVVYLRASADELYRRVARDRNRPLLQTADPKARIRTLLEEREPLYEEVAGLTFETGSAPVPQVVRSLISLLQQYEVKS